MNKSAPSPPSKMLCVPFPKCVGAGASEASSTSVAIVSCSPLAPDVGQPVDREVKGAGPSRIVRCVLTGAADQHVGAKAAVEVVVALTAGEQLRLPIADQRVVAATSEDVLDVGFHVVALAGLSVVRDAVEVDRSGFVRSE